VPQSTMGADLLQPLQVLTELAVHAVCQYLRVLAIDDVALSIEEPSRNLILRRVLDDSDDTFEFFGGDISSADRDILGW